MSLSEFATIFSQPAASKLREIPPIKHISVIEDMNMNFFILMLFGMRKNIIL